jgi:hypothetical protein
MVDAVYDEYAAFYDDFMVEPPAAGARLDVVPGNAEMPSNLLVRAYLSGEGRPPASSV